MNISFRMGICMSNKMSRRKRNASGWTTSFFDLEGFDEPFTRTKITPPAANKEEEEEEEEKKVDESYKFASGFSYKKPSSSLSVLLAACAPQKQAELAVSRQKQTEISRWFKEKVKIGKPNILLVSGPSGCGKTEAFKLIAKENDYQVVEWITPMDQMMNENNRITRQGERFEEFLIRSTRYSSVMSDYSKRLLLVKDLPNTFVEEKDDFPALLKKYCQYGKEPLVFVNTETDNSRLLLSLFSQSNRDRFGIDFINVNAATPTALKNVMKRVSSILNTKASHMLRVTQEKIDQVLANTVGDVRSALLNLIFISLKVDHKFQSECTVREESLGLLHGIGRVIHPKRIAVGKSWRFVHNPDELASNFSSQAGTFIKFVHENCLNTIGFNVEGAAMALEAISLADVLNAEWKDSGMHKLALSCCIRGVMLANDKPVSNWNPVRKPKTNTDYNVRKNSCTAETLWYERYISPKVKQKQLDPGAELAESTIEEIFD